MPRAVDRADRRTDDGLVLGDAARPISDVDHIGIAVPNLQEALHFFTAKLGWVETMRGVAPDGITPVAFVALGSTEFELFEAAGTDTAMLDHIGLRTGDIVAAERTLEASGVPMAGDEVEGVRGRAQRIDSSATLGLFLHLSER